MESRFETHHHGHQPTVQVHSSNHHGHQPSTHVHTSHYADQTTHAHVYSPFSVGYTHRHGYSSGRAWGIGALLLGLLVVPVVILAVMMNVVTSTLAVSTASMTAIGAVGAASAGTALAFGAAAFGLGALIAYGVVGLGYLYSSAKECYENDTNVIDMLKSRVVNEDRSSFKGVMKSIGAVLWSPFLLLGGLAGIGVKVAVTAIHNAKASKVSSETDTAPLTTSHSQMGDLHTHTNDQQKQSSDKEPVHTSSLYADSLKNPSTENLVLDTSQTSSVLFN